ncbi:hypothetical protein KDX04_33445 [Burkholderia cenocepacia]|uniref:hypothetical protein n=1 Tax=Burkholderia cenocepacia TaxID=95486 RepID=UPI001B9088A8|nr:hypothetical protein [Burkholderia cenocepacia]MBR7990748.1 hypothetical protein [Burkholderia cenocepacia]
MENFDAGKDLEKEKSLWQLYRLARNIPRSRSEIAIMSVGAILMLGYVLSTYADYPDILNQVRSIVSDGLNFVASILGFLVAGFTIFVTITKTEVFVAMAKKRHSVFEGLTWFKYSMAVFMYVFAHYFAFIVVAYVVKICLAVGGPAHLARMLLLKYWIYADRLVWGVTAGLLVSLFLWMLHLVLLLKGFIYNIYAVVTTVVRWELEQEKKKADGG